VQLRSCIALALSLGLVGCATQPKADKRVHALELKLKKQRALLQDVKERNLVLEKRVKVERGSVEIGESIGEAVVTSEPPTPLPASFAPTESVTTSKNLPNKLPAKLAVAPAAIIRKPAAPAPTAAPVPISVSTEKTGEHFLYSKILETYRTKNQIELERSTQLLIKSYPESVFADNAVYLGGLLAFENQDYKAALAKFDQLLRDYPRSNKAVAAMFAKASVEKRLGRTRDAKRGFIQVRDLFPGSPEAARVSVELKLLEATSLKRRES